MDIKIVGMTDQQEAYIGSKEYKFRINEFLMIEDKDQGDILGEIVEAHTYNRFIPMDENQGIPDQRMIENLREVGFDLDEDTIYIGKVRLLEEGNYPIETGSLCRIPVFSEVKSYFSFLHHRHGADPRHYKKYGRNCKDHGGRIQKSLQNFPKRRNIASKRCSLSIESLRYERISSYRDLRRIRFGKILRSACNPGRVDEKGNTFIGIGSSL